MKSNMLKSIIIILLGVGAATVSVAQQSMEVAPKKPVLGSPAAVHLCSDFTATIQAQGVTVGKKGVVRIKGTVSNKGPGDYSGRSIDGNITYQAWYPPKTPAQSGDTGMVTKKKLGTKLKKNQSVTLNAQQELPGFTRFGHFPASKMERPAVRIFILTVEPTFTGSPTPYFSACEDQNSNNSRAVSAEIKYMMSVK